MGRNIYYKEGFKAQLAQTCKVQTPIRPERDIVERFYEIHVDGTMIGVEGYCWDFATGGLDTVSILRGSLYHDIGCQAIVEGKLDRKWKGEVDKLFRRLCSQDGMNPLRVWYTYFAVRKGSCRGKPREIKSAPDVRAAWKLNDGNPS